MTAGHGWVEGVGPTDPALQSFLKKLAVKKCGSSTRGHLPHIPPKNKLNSVVDQTNLAVLKAGPPTREKATRLKSVVAKKKQLQL